MPANHTEHASNWLASIATTMKVPVLGVTGLFGSVMVDFPKSLAILALFMAIDYVTGNIAAFDRGIWKKRTAVTGILVKLSVGLAAIAGFFLSGLLPDVQFAGFDLGKIDIGSAISIAFAVTEFISIFDNLGQMGRKLPGPIRKILAGLEHYDDDGKLKPPPPPAENPAAEGSILKLPRP